MNRRLNTVSRCEIMTPTQKKNLREVSLRALLEEASRVVQHRSRFRDCETKCNMWCDRATDGLELELWSVIRVWHASVGNISVRSETWYLPQVICNVTFSADTGAHKTLHFGEAQIINVSFNEPVFIWTRDCEKGIVHKLHYDILAFTFTTCYWVENVRSFAVWKGLGLSNTRV